MNTKQIQFNRQGVAALPFTGLIFALAAGLAWAGADVSGSTLQPAQMAQGCAYSPQPGHAGPARSRRRSSSFAAAVMGRSGISLFR